MLYEVITEPHAFYGRSIADLIMNDQDASTAMIRGLLDNIALTNNPSIDVIEGQANIDDLLNNEIGSIRRIKSRITSYNVCYTKLLRTCSSMYWIAPKV